MNKSDKKALKHWFKEFRNHQRDVMADGGGSIVTFPCGRTEVSFAAPYGEHALSAFLAAKRHIHFRKHHGVPV